MGSRGRSLRRRGFGGRASRRLHRRSIVREDADASAEAGTKKSAG
jgi:hypothetical protein